MENKIGLRKSNNLQNRLFDFAVEVIKLTRKLPKGKEYDVMSFQLIKSSTSTEANYEEAQGAVSKADFVNKVGISLKEMLESSYWIRLIVATTERQDGWKNLLKEAEELKKVLGSIYSKTSIKR